MKNVLVIEIKSFVRVISSWFSIISANHRLGKPGLPGSLLHLALHSSIRQTQPGKETAQNSSMSGGTACPGVGGIVRAQLKKLEVGLWLRILTFQNSCISF